MRRKSKGKRKGAATATATATATTTPISAIPILSIPPNGAAAAAVFDSESDDVNGLNHHAEAEPEPELDSEAESVDIFDKTICIQCRNRGDEKKEERVLICGGSGCPVSIHATCLGSKPKFDDSGNYCCPYCSFKRAMDTCQRLKEKAVAAKRNLSQCLRNHAAARARVKPVVEGTEAETEVRSEEKKEEEGETRAVVDSTAAARVSLVQDGEAQSEEKKDEDGKDSEKLGEEMETETEEKKDEEGKEGNEEELVEEMETKGQSEDEEGKVAVKSSSVSETNDLESEGVSVKKRKGRKKNKKVASAGKSLVVFKPEPKNKRYNTRGKIEKEEEEEVTSLRTLSLRKQPQSRMKQSSPTSSAKRKRLHWTDKEEKILREGVSKFSTENQNIPWRKILEFGCHVFDKTRTPVDLKDKWKNIISKEGLRN